MESSTPTRRLALQNLSVNVALKASPGITNRLGAKASYPSKPAKLAEEPCLDESKTSAGCSPVRAEARLGGQKRGFGLVQDVVRGRGAAGGPEEAGHSDGGASARKRVKTVGEVPVDDGLLDQSDRYENPAIHLSAYEEDATPLSLSSRSSLESSQHGLNDTYSTVVTEPDDSHIGAMSRVELRQKARALKLRLRLAKYKVQTNQINTPIAQLQIKSTSDSPKLPSVSRFANKPQHRPLSSASRYSDIQTGPDLGDTRSFTSSPPPHIELPSHDESRDGS